MNNINTHHIAVEKKIRDLGKQICTTIFIKKIAYNNINLSNHEGNNFPLKQELGETEKDA
jgi:hypothetical protein